MTARTVGHGPVKYRPINAAFSGINKLALTQGLIKFNTEHATTSLLRLNELCVIQNIPIILSEGTALGAVRDGKLIPWDDDIDIMIEASHKERFISHVIPQMKNFWNADEATSALDDKNRDIVFDLLRNRAVTGANVLLITHDNEIANRCDTSLHMGKK